MAFDTDTRNKLAKLVADARNLLHAEFTSQLQEVYGIQPDGKMADLIKLSHLDDEQRDAARLMRERVAHLASGMGSEKNPVKAAVERMTREQAFTILNRFAALRMIEERGLLQQCVGGGLNSKGFQVYLQTAGSALGNQYERYRAYTFAVFDEIAVDLGVLFDRFSPFGLLFPREKSLADLFEIINQQGLKNIWIEDETIGWVYQYFNTAHERKAMRDASAAPRNSRELAVRNQFFTPRYVVEFLTDNTLGRIWYEMRKGDTALKDECRYLVRWPNEVFLSVGEKAPTEPENRSDRTQEDLLKQPVYVKHRPKKDPRDFLILDPACGSGHFLIYAFDLLEWIYREAWGDPESPKHEMTGRTLQNDFETLDDLRRELPKLTMEHNLHGVDIDPRAVQIAALALWLRTQKTWKSLDIKAGERPRVAKSNIVSAESMPGQEDMRREFTAALKPRILGQLVDVVFNKMKLAGEAGSLLKIEEEIRDVVSEAKAQWLKGPRPEQQLFFPGMCEKRPKQQELQFDFEGITNEGFWEQAEDLILGALKDYSENTLNSHIVGRRLFADDAARGFAFIDLCRKKYDVVVMNPPFGDASLPSKPYIEEFYGDTKGDVYKTFVECFQDRLIHSGMLGIISSRTGFFLGQSSDWRQRVLLRIFKPTVIADFGFGVLDAMVETAAYVLRSLNEKETKLLTLSLVPDLLRVACDKNGDFSIPKYIKARGGNLKRHQAIGELSSLISANYLVEHKSTSYRKFRITQKVKNDLTLNHLNQVGAQELLTCFRLLNLDNKNDSLLSMVSNLHSEGVFIINPQLFDSVPGTPFAYWASKRILNLFNQFPPFEGDNRTSKQGLATADDFRFLRLWWEIPAKDVLPPCNQLEMNGKQIDLPKWCRDQTFNGKRWVPYAKGGEYSPYNSDIHLYVNWENDGEQIKAFVVSKPGTSSWSRRVAAYPYYFFQGVTWPKVTISGLSTRPLPAGCIFSVGGLAAFLPNDFIRYWIGFTNSSVAELLMRLMGSWHNWEAGTMASLPFSEPKKKSLKEINCLVEKAIELAESANSSEIMMRSSDWLNVLLSKVPQEMESAEDDREKILFKQLQDVNRQIEKLVAEEYGLDEYDLDNCHSGLETESRFTWSYSKTSRSNLFFDFFCFAVGALYGRWDIRIAVDSSLSCKLSDPFASPPTCPPSMLLGIDGLAANSQAIVSEEWLHARPDANSLPQEGAVQKPIIPNTDYPIWIAWNGLLVDDSGYKGTQPHRNDIVRRVREVLDLLWNEKAHDIEQEACDILNVSNLHEYFRKPAKFFQDHLKRYSKSRRKAPIYWPLSSESGSYTLWVYYHRLTDQTLYICVTDFVEPKLHEISMDIERLQKELEVVGDRKKLLEIEKLKDFRQELFDLKDEMLRIANLPYKPNLNDGVMITASPLWRLFRHKPWQKNLKACWEKLKAGNYDWAHLSYSIWPERVREKCKTDRSIAIAHGLEKLCEVEPKKSRKKKSEKKSA